MLPDEERDLRIAAIAAALVACAALRLAGEGDHGPVEFVPVLGAAVWFGRRWAFVATAVALAVVGVSEQVHGTWDLSMTAMDVALLALTAEGLFGVTERLLTPGSYRPSAVSRQPVGRRGTAISDRLPG